MTVPWDSRWKEVPGFPTYYLNQYGQVFSMKRMKLLSQFQNQKGVPCVRLWQKFPGEKSKGYNRSVTKLVELIFPKETQVFDKVVSEMLKKERDGLEHFLLDAANKLGLSPEEFATEYELEVYPNAMEMLRGFSDDEVRYRFTTTYKLKPKEKN